MQFLAHGRRQNEVSPSLLVDRDDAGIFGSEPRPSHKRLTLRQRGQAAVRRPIHYRLRARRSAAHLARAGQPEFLLECGQWFVRTRD